MVCRLRNESLAQPVADGYTIAAYAAWCKKCLRLQAPFSVCHIKANADLKRTASSSLMYFHASILGHKISSRTALYQRSYIFSISSTYP